MSDDGPRFKLVVHDRELSGQERREIERMVHHVLDGDAVFAVEGYEWQQGDGEKLERFLEEELQDDE